MNPYYARILSIMGINIILASSLNLTNGYAGVFSLGHGAFMAVGAYTCSILSLSVEKKTMMIPGLPSLITRIQLPYAISIVIGGLVAMGFALIIGYSVLRLRGHYLALATLGFMVIVNGLLVNLKGWTRGPRGLNGIPPFTTIWSIYISVLLVLYICWRFVNSHFGRSLKAIRENELAAQAFGINPFQLKMTAFCLGACMAGWAGGLWAHLITAITPHSFSYSLTFNIVMMVIIGGPGSISGSVVGAALLTVFPEIMRVFERGGSILGINLPPMYGLSNIVLAITMIVILFFKPNGLMGFREFQFPCLLGRRKSMAEKGYNGTI